MHLVFDANVIYKEGFASSRLFRFLETSAPFLGHKFYFPAVVIDEVTAKLEREIQEEVNGPLRKWRITLGKSLEPQLDPQEEARALRDKLHECGMVLKYPRTSHEELAKRAIDRTKPFRENDSGYRDSLIWESVVELSSAVEDDDQIVLMSSDKVFKGRKGGLAGELKADLDERGIHADKVVLVRSVADFLRHYIQPTLKPAMRAVLEGSATAIFEQFDLDPYETISEWISEEYPGKEWDREDLGMPWEYETITLSMVEDVSDLEKLEVGELSEGKCLLQIAATLDCEFDAFVDKGYAYGLDDFTIFEHDWNSHYVAGSTSRTFRCMLNISITFPEDSEPEFAILSMEPSEPEFAIP